jgi:hypothetical protein
MRNNPVSIAPLLDCRSGLITNLGVRASMGDYTQRERNVMLSAGLILFPTPRFADVLEAAGKQTFPSAFAYRIRKSRVAQEVLFQFLDCPHPRTRIYYGRQKRGIPDHFRPPFLAMGPSMSTGARLFGSAYDPPALFELYNPLIIQDFVECEERFQLVFVNYECAGILKKAPCGGRLVFDSSAVTTVPRPRNAEMAEHFSGEIVSRLEELLRSVKLNDIAVEVGITRKGWQLIQFGRPPLSWPSREGVVERFSHICRLIESGRLQ